MIDIVHLGKTELQNRHYEMDMLYIDDFKTLQ